MNKKLSIIVPVYKVEKYLNECVESLVNQTYKNLEIILVDDGSPDNCPSMCDDWAKRDDRIKVIHKENGGLSDARNFGIRSAIGEYITFVDSDDYVEKNTYELAINKLNNTNSQIFIFGRSYLYGNKKKYNSNNNIELVMSNIEALDKMNMFQYYDVSACDKVYERNLFNGIKFPIGKLSEDWYTIYKAIDRADKIVYNSIPLYVYRQRTNSITHSDSVKINMDPIYASKEVLQFVEKKYPRIRQNALSKYVFASIGVYNNLVCYKSDSKIEQGKILKELKKSYNEVIKNKDLVKSRIIQLFLVCYFTKLYNMLIKVFKKYKERRAK